VIVSAGIKPGSAPAQLVMDWVLEGQVQAVTSPWIVEEYREVARRAKFRRYGFPPQWLEFLIEESLHLPDPATWPTLPGADPKDIPFLAVAHRAGAWLVTGNLKHFPEAARSGVQVLSPADYLSHLTER
jgi:predicted nucleic acid-binding protein